MEALDQQSGMKRIASSSSVAGMVLSNYGSIYSNVWKAVQLLSADPSPLVIDVARKLIMRVRQKVRTTNSPAAQQVIILSVVMWSVAPLTDKLKAF